MAALSSHAHAQAKEFDVNGGGLKSALDVYVVQSGVQLLYKIDDVQGVSTSGVSGALSPEEALARLLEGTSLLTRRGEDDVIVIYTNESSSDATRQAAGERAQALDIVTVTAARRREPVREVPMQVDVMKSETLERAGAKNLADYVAEQPGVNIQGNGASMGALSIRGLTNGATGMGATVGVYVDDVATGSSSPYAASATTPLDMGLLDLHHVEVVRGPQGTLYGAGAMGGVLRYITNQPDTTEFTGAVKLGSSWTRGGGAGYTLNGMLNVPLKEDTAALRIAAFSERSGGSYDAIGLAGGRNVDRGHKEGGRVSLLLTPSRELTVRMTAIAQESRRNGIGVEEADVVNGRLIARSGPRQLSYAEPFHNRTALFGFDVEYDFGWARFNAITSAQDMKIDRTNDFSLLYVPALAARGIPVTSVGGFTPGEQHRVSQEFRLTSQSGGQFEWLAGLYLNRERAANPQQVNGTLAMTPREMSLFNGTQDSKYRETAAYGNVTWNITPALSLTGGLRAARNHQTFTATSSGLLAGSASSGDGKSSEKPMTYLGTLKYALDKTSNVYFRAASGYRPGGANSLVPGAPKGTVPAMYTSDSLWSYELGYKTQLLDRKLSLEAALYDIEWKDMQQVVVTNGFGYLVNAGGARVRGGELVLNWTPSAEWRFDASASGIDGRLTSDSDGLQAKAGTRLPVTPRFSAVLGATRNFKIDGHDAYVGVRAHYTGKRNAGYPGSSTLPSLEMPAFTQIDLQAGIALPRFSLGFYVRNLTDRRGVVAADTSKTGPGRALVGLIQPRTFGMNLTVPF